MGIISLGGTVFFQVGSSQDFKGMLDHFETWKKILMWYYHYYDDYVLLSCKYAELTKSGILFLVSFMSYHLFRYCN